MANFMKRGNKWQARVTWRDGNGKLHQKSKSVFYTKKQAWNFAVKIVSEKLSGVFI